MTQQGERMKMPGSAFMPAAMMVGGTLLLFAFKRVGRRDALLAARPDPRCIPMEV